MLPKSWQEFFAHQAEQRAEKHLVRKLRVLRHLAAGRVQVGSHELINFSSNDYLGLAGDLRIAEAAARAAGRFGWATASSRLVSGTSTLHNKLENETARFRGTSSALLFGSGYQTNLGVISACMGVGDTVFSDAANHNSIVAGCRLSRATVKVFRNLDYDGLKKQLEQAPAKGKRMIVSDSLFSIQGIVADIKRLADLADEHSALLLIDDAHANASLGKQGRGIPELQGVADRVPVIVGTFSKSLGSYGGFVACDEELRVHLINHSRPFAYTTSLPVAVAAANLEALKIVRKEGTQLREKLAGLVRILRTKLEAAEFKLSGDHHIIGVAVGSSANASAFANALESKGGMLVYAMRWPSVPEGAACLRISVSAAHSDNEIYRLVSAMKAARDRVSGKATSKVSRRQTKRPTHRKLSTNEMEVLPDEGLAAFDAFGDGAEPDGGGERGEAGATLRPGVSEPPADAGTSEVDEPRAKTRPERMEDNDGTIPPVDPEVTDEFPVTDEQEEESEGPSPGETLPPTPIELADPIIDNIEGGTKRREKPKTGRETRKTKQQSGSTERKTRKSEQKTANTERKTKAQKK